MRDDVERVQPAELISGDEPPILSYRRALPDSHALRASDIFAALLGVALALVMSAASIAAVVGACMLAQGGLAFVVIMLFVFIGTLAAAIEATGTTIAIIRGHNRFPQGYYHARRLKEEVLNRVFTGTVGTALVIVVCFLIPKMIRDNAGVADAIESIVAVVVMVAIAGGCLRHAWVGRG